MRKLVAFLYGAERFEYFSDVPIELAINRLDLAVQKTSFTKLTSERMVGTVNRDSVKIQRVIPLLQNSFKPIFIGSFSLVGDRIVLSGTFRIHRYVQISMTFWLGFLTLWVMIATTVAFIRPSEAWFFPLFGILMFWLGAGLVKLGKWFSRNDIEWLRENIRNAIENDSL